MAAGRRILRGREVDILPLSRQGDACEGNDGSAGQQLLKAAAFLAYKAMKKQKYIVNRRQGA